MAVFILSYVKRKKLGRLWLAYTEVQVDFSCYNLYPLTLDTLRKDLGLL